MFLTNTQIVGTAGRKSL